MMRHIETDHSPVLSEHRVTYHAVKLPRVCTRRMQAKHRAAGTCALGKDIRDLPVRRADAMILSLQPREIDVSCDADIATEVGEDSLQKRPSLRDRE